MMSIISELPDPYTLKGKSRYFISKVKRFAVKAKRIFSEPHLLRALLKSQALRRTRIPPVIGYTEGASGSLNKRALMTYVAKPFYMGPELLHRPHHSNVPQAIEIAKAFNRLGFIVDIVDWLDDTFIPTSHYDVFFGMHYNFERLLPYLDAKTVKIYYGTGAYWSFEIAAEKARIEDLEKRRGVRLELPVRLGPNNWVQIADAVIVLGNEWTASTYRPHARKLFTIDNTALPVAEPDLEKKDFVTARQNFLWFGSTGLLHKGLDLVLEAFTELRDLHLWVCGPLQAEAEREFIRVYRRELFHTPNIHPIGWISVYSDEFKWLTDHCAFVILASCSEGMSGAVLNCMARGLIPLVSRETGIDTDDFGVTFEKCSIDEIRQVITDMAKQPPGILRHMAQEAFKQTRIRYSLDSFSQNIERILRTILTR